MGGLSDESVESLLEERKLAREQADYVKSDAIRASLLLHGIALEDEERSLCTSWKRFSVNSDARGTACMCWLRRSNRFCGESVAEQDGYFCASHQQSHKGRVPCPLDPKHAVALSKLAGHLKFCQYSQVAPPEHNQHFVKPGFNAGKSAVAVDGELISDKRVPIPAGAADDELDQLGAFARRILTALWSCGSIENSGSTSSLLVSDDPEMDIRTIVALAMQSCEEGLSESKGPPWGSGSVRLRPRPFEAIVPAACEHLIAKAPAACKRKAKNGRSHALQQASIAGHLERAGWMRLVEDRSACRRRVESVRLSLVEFGAGSARLSGVLASLAETPFELHVLVDRRDARRTADRSLRSLHGCYDGGKDDEDIAGSLAERTQEAMHAATVTRVQCDISDLDLGECISAPVSNSSPQGSLEIIAVGKHVCGVASDLSLRCCLQGAASGSLKFRGIALAFCCHHECDWSSYVGKEWLASQGVTEADFGAMRWFSKMAHTQYEQRENGIPRPFKSVGSQAAAARAELGHLCKRLIDEGRLAWMRDSGWNCRLVRFVDRQTSPENALLLAWPAAKPQEIELSGRS
eukprot:TRINITY_DN16883_c0_g1_i1.p1 TRINITY_DN16883_c0_g1~~TRINITY_DN16883_c0_g1_i1.p1  ORF type:complete len:578 (-),score=72.01 TRINITY_DN16883_c0_g1_i1:14-1747(-)